MIPIQKRLPDDDELLALRAKVGAIASSFGHNYLGVEHVFLALRELPPQHPVWEALRSADLDLDQFFADLERRARATFHGSFIPKSLPLTPRLKRILRNAADLARNEKATHLTPLHFLSAVAHERESLPALILVETFRKTHPEGSVPSLPADSPLHRLFSPR